MDPKVGIILEVLDSDHMCHGLKLQLPHTEVSSATQ